MKSTTLLLWLFSILFCTPYFAEEEFGAETTPQGAREFSVPVAEVLQVPVYLTQNGYGEVVVRAAGKGSDFKEHDHLTHADGIRILNGGLDTFIQSGEQEVVVPVIDDEADDLHGEGKLLGFVMLTSVIPRKLSARRGDLVYDLEEGGEQPSLQVGNIMLSSSGATNKGDKDYTPPPHGGGSCITDRDCYYAKGDCVAGKCVCEEPLTGSFCQLYRPGRSSLSPLAKREQDADAARFHSSVNENKVELTRRADQKLAAQQAKMQQLSAASKHRGGQQGGKNEHFGFAFGKGPPLSRTGGTATALKEARGLRHNIGGGSGLDGQRVLPPGRAGASLHAAVGGDGGGGDSIQHQRQRLREREKEKEQARASSLPANTNDNGIEAAGGGDRGGVPTLQDLQRQSQEERGKAATATATNNNDNNNNAVSADSDSGNGSSGKAKAKAKAKTKVKTKVKAKAKSPSSPQQEEEQEQPSSASASASASSSASAPEGEKSELLQQYERGELDLTDTRIRFKVERAKREEETRLARIEERKRREAGARAARAGEDATQRDMEEFQRELKKIEVTEPDKRADPGAKEAMHRQNQQANMATMDDLYGPGKAYPEPYAAGKVPPELVHARHKARHENRPFIFSVRYRSGPLGLSFDNKPADRTVVERVGKSMQSDLSDVQAGDRVLSVDQYNVTNASAKMTQRIMSSLGWPRVVVFEVKSSEAVEKMAAEESLKQRSLNLSVVFPPTVQGQYPARTPQWTPLLTPNSFAYGDAGGATTTQACPLFLVQSTQDEFGCDVNIPPEDYSLPWQVVQMGRQHLRETGRDWRSWGPPVSESVQVGLEGEGKSEVGVHDDVDRAAFDEKTDYYTVHAELFPMLAMTLLQASEQQIAVDLHSMVVMKRGICTFVSKSSRLRKNGASAGVIVNTEEKLDDMQKGKGDDTTNCHAPTAIVQEEAGTLLHVATLKVSQRGDYSSNGPKTASPEVLALAGDDTSLTPSCERIRSLVDELMDLWPHSVPRLTTDQLLSEAQRKAVSNHPRPQADEGGRLAVGGDNGWAFFDYHIAMFGEQEVPLGPHRLQMALPPHGCDPSAYQVRIKDSIVAILRGGGCSFGIKVINAQRLGARAVVIVNTDESKNMRLMALPDEEPQISIPCVMVSRRFQYYLEGQMRRYWVNDQHLISLQPTSVFGNYEERSLEVRRGRGG